MEQNNFIDYGEWNIPKSWSELSLKKFQEIEAYYADSDKTFDVRDVLSILCDKTEDEVNSLPMEFTEKIIEQMAWLQETPQYGEPTNKLVIDGETYTVHNENTLKTGEYIAFDTVIKQDKHNYAAMLAILARKEGEVYDSKFENEILPERIKMFEQIPMIEAMRIIHFFMICYMLSNRTTQLYSAVEQALDLTAKHIENSHRNGLIGRLSMKYAMRKLKRLRKITNSI